MVLRFKSPLLLLTLLVCATYLPFINQAVHIDDRIYLEIADNILEKPLYPYDYPPIFEGYQAPDAASHSHLPLVSYYLAVIKLTTGSSREWVLHLGFIVFPLLAAWAVYDVARRFVRWPLAVACLMVVSPAFMTLSHTLMADVPLLSLWLVAFSGFLSVLDTPESKRGWLVLAAGLIGASLMSITTVIPIALFGGAVAYSRQPSDRRQRISLLLLLIAPFAIWVLWFVAAYQHYDRFVLILTVMHMSHRQTLDWWLVGVKGVSFLLNIGALFFMPIVAWLGFGGRFRTPLALLVLGLAWIPFAVWFPNWTWAQVVLFSIFLATGCLVVFSVVWPPVVARGQSDGGSSNAPPPGLLTVWFFAFLLACLFMYYSGSARYTLPAIPPVIVLWALWMERRFPNHAQLRKLMAAAVVLTGIYSYWISYGDYRFAGLYRETAKTLARDYRASDRTVWIAGEWGFRYYMNEAGAKTILKTTTTVRPGDIIIKPYVAMPWVTAYDSGEYTELVEQREARADSRVRILDFGSKAGFYSTGWGMLPFSLSNGDRWEWFNVYRVKKQYTGPPPEENRPY